MNQFVEYENEEETPTIYNWIEHNATEASHVLGEDVVSAVVEAFEYE